MASDPINPFQAAGWQLVNGVWTQPTQTPPGTPPGTTPPPGGPPATGPGYGGKLPDYLLGKTAENLNDQLSGVLPEDVVNQLRNSAAAFGVANGLAGSDFSGYRGLTNLGLTSLDQMNKATAALTPMFTTQKEGANLSLEQQKLAEQRRQFDQQMLLEREKQKQVAARTNPTGGYNPVPGYGRPNDVSTYSNIPSRTWTTDPTGRPMW